MIGWSLLATEGAFNASVEGIVLLDELEQHLHPSWQQAIVGRLEKAFPGIQFIATTHSPLVAVGSTALRDECCQLILMQHADQGIMVRSGLKPPRGRRADQVLTSYLFGLASTSSDDIIQGIQRYAFLRQLDSPDEEAKREIEDLRKRLTSTLGWAETELRQMVERAVQETLDRMTEEGATDMPKDALSFEMRRQIRDLFDSTRDGQ